MRLIASLLATSVFVAMPTLSLAQVALTPIDMTVIEHRIFDNGFCDAGVAGTYGPEFTVAFDCSPGSSGTLTGSNADGRIVLQINETAAGGLQTRYPSITSVVSFSVPQSRLGDTPILMSTLAGTLSGVVIGPPNVGVAPSLYHHQIDSLIFGGAVVYPNESVSLYGGLPSSTGIYQLIGGDDVTAEISFFCTGVHSEPTSGQTMSATFTYELQFVPEPSTSLTVPAGIGLLAGLARLRGVAVVR